MTFLNWFLEWKLLSFDVNFTRIGPKGPINIMSKLVQKTDWCQSGNNALPEATMD